MIFSKRHGFTKPSDVIIRGNITPEIKNAICTCYDLLEDSLVVNYYHLEQYIWCNFLHRRKKNFWINNSEHHTVCTVLIEDETIKWYKKLDLIEETLKYLEKNDSRHFHQFAEELNEQFERLKFGYRIIDGSVIEITSEQELKTITTALEENSDNIRMHLDNALKSYSQRPNADYRTSIKESISAVEAFNRQITGEKTLNLKKMERSGLKIPSVLEKAFSKLYGYTNDEQTGIRHALMDETGEYVPNAEEALYMLITCSAFINYLKSKIK